MIPTLEQFFELNAVPVYFVYGLVFFVLGLAIAMQKRQLHRYLNRSLNGERQLAMIIPCGFYRLIN